MASGDLNGDSFDDLVIGTPGARDTAQAASGFHILYGFANELTTTNSQLLGQLASGQIDKTGDRFGAALAVGDVNGDRVADLIVGASGRSNGAGQAYVYHGRRGQPLSGVASRILQNSLFSGSAEAGDLFGSTIDAKDINNDGFADVVIGAPGEDKGTGAVHKALGSSAGVASNASFLQQGISGLVVGTREAGDLFGTGIAIGNFNGAGTAEIGISVPGESFGNFSGGGLVNIVPG